MSDASAALKPGLEASWRELASVLGSYPDLSRAWMTQRADAVVYHALPVHYRDGRLAARFVRCRYGADGPQWLCQFVDPCLIRPPHEGDGAALQG